MRIVCVGKSISDAVNVVVMTITSTIIFAMFVISLIGIFHKFVLGNSLSWPFSINRIMLPWVAMLSLTVALKSGEHIAMGILAERLPIKLQKVVKVFNYLLVGIFGVAMAWLGYGYFLSSNQLFMVSSNIQVSGMWAAGSIPVCGLIICIHMLSGPDLLTTHEPEVKEPSDAGRLH